MLTFGAIIFWHMNNFMIFKFQVVLLVVTLSNFLYTDVKSFMHLLFSCFVHVDLISNPFLMLCF